MAGGSNGVFVSNGNGVQTGVQTINMGEPEPVDAAVSRDGDPEPSDIDVAHDGTVYWTCTSAGVIVRATPIRH